MSTIIRREANISLWDEEIILNFTSEFEEDGKVTNHLGYIEFPQGIDLGAKIKQLWNHLLPNNNYPFKDLSLELTVVTAWMRTDPETEQSLIVFEVLIGGIKISIYYVDDKGQDGATTIFAIEPQGDITIDSLPGVDTQLPDPIKAGMSFYLASADTTIIWRRTEDGPVERTFEKGFSISCNIEWSGVVNETFVYNFSQSVERAQNGPLAEATKGMKKWFKLDKRIGNIATIHRIGLGYEDGKVALFFDLDANLSRLQFSLIGLKLALELKYLSYFQSFGKSDSKWEVIKNFTADAVSFGLDGLGIGLETKAFSIAGLMLKNEVEVNGKNYEQYIGGIRLKTKSINLAAIGAYGTIEGYKSFFLYGFLGSPIGGPPYFFVNGLAMGFGNNRQVKIPTVDKVGEFPLVTMAINKPEQESSELETIAKMIPVITETFPPLDDNLFFAVGVKFNSFKLLDGFLLLIVSIGEDIGIDVLGLLVLAMPKDKPVAIVEVAIKASISLQEGSIKVDGLVTENSYLFSERAKLTGGFAFYAWLKDKKIDEQTEIKAGDFVMTTGGYHPEFKKPPYYPIVPRFGLNWRVTDNFVIKAQAYYAMTSGAVMAGGELSVVYHSKRLDASFKVHADFLIQWKPFYYDISAGISIKVEYRALIKTWRFSLGIDVHIWGPEFSGKARIDFKVIGYTIEFGSRNKPSKEKLTLSEFEQEFLPSDNGALSLNILDGIIQELPEPLNSAHLIKRGSREIKPQLINPKDFSFNVESIVPFNHLLVSVVVPERQERHIIQQESSNNQIGIVPVQYNRQNQEIRSTCIIDIYYQPSLNQQLDAVPANNFFQGESISKNLPLALWGLDPKIELNPVEGNTTNQPCGFSLKTRPPVQNYRKERIPEYINHKFDKIWSWSSLGYYHPKDPAPFKPTNTFGLSAKVFEEHIGDDFTPYSLRTQSVTKVNNL